MNSRNWLSVILEDKGVDLSLIADEPVTIHSPIGGLTRLEFTLRISLTDEEFAKYAKVNR